MSFSATVRLASVTLWNSDDSVYPQLLLLLPLQLDGLDLRTTDGAQSVGAHGRGRAGGGAAFCPRELGVSSDPRSAPTGDGQGGSGRTDARLLLSHPRADSPLLPAEINVICLRAALYWCRPVYPCSVQPIREHWQWQARPADALRERVCEESLRRLSAFGAQPAAADCLLAGWSRRVFAKLVRQWSTRPPCDSG